MLPLAACALLEPRLEVHGETANRQARAAPLVVVGVVEPNETIGWARTSQMQMCRMRVGIENVLRGELPDRSITAYYFRYRGGFTGPRPLGFWDERSLRRVFWLERDSGVYRSACDGIDCTLAIYSAAHPDYQRGPNQTVEQAIIDLQLTRGKSGVDEDWFASSVEQSALLDESVGLYFAEKLNTLAQTEGARIREAACKTLTHYGRACPNPTRGLP